MTATPPPNVPAGWYPDPDQVDTQRYWAGSEWTDQRAPMTPQYVSPLDELSTPPGLVAAGVATALLFPIAGFVIGVVLITRYSRPQTGVAIMILSAVVTYAAYRVLSQPTVTYYGY